MVNRRFWRGRTAQELLVSLEELRRGFVEWIRAARKILHGWKRNL